jgi:hypothetical protein
VLSFKPGDPAIQGAARFLVATPQRFDATANLTEHEDAQPDGPPVDGFKPGPNVGVGPFSLPELGDDVRVEKPSAQRSTSRRLARGRAKSSSVPTSGIAESVALSDPRPSPRRASRRISRCSASADRLCSAARRFKETTTWFGRFRTTSCAIAINDSTRYRRAPAGSLTFLPVHERERDIFVESLPLAHEPRGSRRQRRQSAGNSVKQSLGAPEDEHAPTDNRSTVALAGPAWLHIGARAQLALTSRPGSSRATRPASRTITRSASSSSSGVCAATITMCSFASSRTIPATRLMPA